MAYTKRLLDGRMMVVMIVVIVVVMMIVVALSRGKASGGCYPRGQHGRSHLCLARKRRKSLSCRQHCSVKEVANDFVVVVVSRLRGWENQRYGNGAFA